MDQVARRCHELIRNVTDIELRAELPVLPDVFRLQGERIDAPTHRDFRVRCGNVHVP